MKKNSYITVTDQFCGAGGSSQGARKALDKVGGIVKLALNHWKLAIETHNSNFPETMHDCTDLSACDPRRYPSTDILITSPECTNHSLAKGQKAVKTQMDMFDKGILDPSAERSRATMWDVPRFAEYHKYNIIIVENVVDARKWVQFPAWLMAMDLLGYNHKAIYHNSMHHHPTPQSRDRMYVIFWRKGNPAPDLEFRPKAYCPDCGKDVEAFQSWKNQNRHGKYKQQYVYACPVHILQVEPYYFAAYNCIDWSDLGTKIGDRKKPLSENTIKRIEYGLKKYGKQPLQVISYSPGYTKPMGEPTGTLTSSDHHGLLTPPLIINDQHSTGAKYRNKSVLEGLRTVTTEPHLNLFTPFIFKAEHSANLKGAKQVSGPIPTQTTRQSMAMVVPFIINNQQTTGIDFRVKSAKDRLPTIATSHQLNLVVPPAPIVVTARGKSKAHSSTNPLTTQSQMINHGIVTDEAFNSFISYYYGNHQASGINEAIGSCTTKDRHQLISYSEPLIDDCFYRMLKPHEIKAAMAFESDYIILGSGKDQVKQCGNAVTPPVMEWIVERCVQSLN